MTDRPTSPNDPTARTSPAEGARDGISTDCTCFRAIVSGFVDGELGDVEQHGAECHLVHCEECRTLVERIESADSDLRSLAGLWGGDSICPAHLVSRVLDRTTRVGRRDRRWRVVGTVGWAAAAALAVAWIATARLGFTPDRPSDTDGVRLVSDGLASVDGAPAVSDRTTSGPARDRPTERRPAPENRVARSGAPGNAVGTSATDVDASREARLRTGIAQSPSHRVPSIDSDRRLGLAATLPALHGEIDWTGARRGARGSTEPRGGVDGERSPLRPVDSDTVFATSVILDRLLRLDAANVEELDRLRYVIAYDDLIERLAETRHRLDPVDRPLVTGAECFLIRLLRGPTEEATILQMKADLERLGLHEKLETLSDRLELRQTF